MKFSTVLGTVLLLALCCVSAASAGGMVKFHIPTVENAKVDDTVTATIYNDNNLNPLTGYLSLYLDWNIEVMKFEVQDRRSGLSPDRDEDRQHARHYRRGHREQGRDSAGLGDHNRHGLDDHEGSPTLRSAGRCHARGHGAGPAADPTIISIFDGLHLDRNGCDHNCLRTGGELDSVATSIPRDRPSAVCWSSPDGI